MSVVAYRRGNGAHRQRIDMLRELHEAGLINYVGVATRGPSTYLVQVDGDRLLLSEEQVAPFCIGFAAALGKARRPLPVIDSEVVHADVA